MKFFKSSLRKNTYNVFFMIIIIISLIFHLLETTILSKSTESNRIACFDE